MALKDQKIKSSCFRGFERDHVTARVNDFAETRVKNHVKF